MDPAARPAPGLAGHMECLSREADQLDFADEHLVVSEQRYVLVQVSREAADPRESVLARHRLAT
jgi:hypothetical protein